MAPVDLAAFEASLTSSTPPEDLPPLLLALWHDGRGDWDPAHRVAQDVAGEDAAWVHAYLHRKEGDQSNAGYWYRIARRPPSREPLPHEWRALVTALLSR